MSRAPLIRFSDLVGLEGVRDTLCDRARSGQSALTLLLVGPEGAGKRSLARAWVAWLCCPAGRDSNEACGRCRTCVQLAAGSYPDALWIEVAGGKREIGIERARELKRFLTFAPVQGDLRVGVIENADCLTIAAQNALLKVLEEPPPRTWLLLTSSTPDSLLPTVRSRCQRIAVPPLSPTQLREALTRHGVPPETIETLLPLAEGSVGRALKLHQHVRADFVTTTANFLAGIGQARYAAIARFAEELNRDDAGLEARLQVMLAILREQVVKSCSNRPAARAAAARGAILLQAWRTLRESYANRQLLIESMLLEMASAEP
ncbi:MAG: DNA polymerase III subunit delta' [Candidatus Binatia bacterium]|nr:MAG: DNA polymerase III subunit delta' [Candidatus Binatia bacterium]